MALNLADRLLTIVVTATLTSAAWLVAGNTRVDLSGAASEAGARVSQAATREDVGGPSAVQSGAAAPAARPGALIIPVVGIEKAQLSDTFTDARGGGSRPHDAIDIMAPTGTPVVAAAPGTVEKLFRSADGGNTIYVRSADRRTIHYYAHLDRYAAGLAEGQKVAQGQPLGTVGASGNANPAAPHLHFAVLRTTPAANWYDPTTAINPYPLFAGR